MSDHGIERVKDGEKTANKAERNGNLNVAEGKRHGKLTEKALEAKLDNKQKIRKAKLGQLTSKINVIEPMLQDFSNAEHVSQQFHAFNRTAADFKALHRSVQTLLSQEEKVKDHEQWYIPKAQKMGEFYVKVTSWLTKVPPVIATPTQEAPHSQ